MQTQTPNTFHNVIMEAGSKDRPPMLALGIDNDIYSTVDACPNAWEMWKAIKRTRGKTIINSPQPIHDQEPLMVAEDDETLKDKEIDKPMALISLSRANQDNSPRINRSVGYENQRIGNVVGARETVEQDDWRDDIDDDELEDQELEARYMYMAQLQEVSPDAADSGPIFDDEPLQKVSNDDHYNVFAIESAHPEEEIDQNDDDNDLAKERELLASLIEKLKYEIDGSKNRNKFLETSNKVLIEKLKDKLSAHQETISILSQQKEAQIKLYKTQEDKELDKVIKLEQKSRLKKYSKKDKIRSKPDKNKKRVEAGKS
nr:hypothetical protein [Tanacetum cinerariifolium]